MIREHAIAENDVPEIAVPVAVASPMLSSDTLGTCVAVGVAVGVAIGVGVGIYLHPAQ